MWGTRIGEQLKSLVHAPRSTAPARAQVGSSLDRINDQFHDTYDQARGVAHRDIPVFLVLADDLIVFRKDERNAFPFSPRAFHVIKSICHAPLAIFAAYQCCDESKLSAAQRHTLLAQQDKLHAALRELADDHQDLTAAAHTDLETILRACLGFLEQLPDHATDPRVESFAKQLGPVLLRLADAATQLQLDALHAHVEQALQQLEPDELRALQVVVAGEHQARARSLPMQYFRARLNEPEHTERRVTYAEGVADEQAALALIGTRKLDHAIGAAFFDDPQRLQRDVLGDAAKRRLDAAALPAIELPED